jgi:hypothetical protein
MSGFAAVAARQITPHRVIQVSRTGVVDAPHSQQKCFEGLLKVVQHVARNERMQPIRLQPRHEALQGVGLGSSGFRIQGKFPPTDLAKLGRICAVPGQDRISRQRNASRSGNFAA